MAETFHTNLVNITEMFTRKTGVKVTAKSIQERLAENPYFPSLYALSNVLDRLHIDNTAVKVEKENMDSLPTPFIAYLDNQPTGKDFATIVSVTPERITYYAENKKARTVSRDDFEKNWSGIVLLAEPDEQSGEPDYNGKRKKEIMEGYRTHAVIAGAIVILFLAVFSFLSPLRYPVLLKASLMLLIKSVGLTAAVLLLIYEIDRSNAFVKNICTAGRHTNCDAVLRSSASKFMGMSWSEIGFFYFASTFLFLLLPGIDFAAKASVLAIANLVAVPYVLFSIYYQWKVVKQWCPLCLTVQAVLAAELAWSMGNVWMGEWVSFPAVILVAVSICVILPVVCWYTLKPIITKAKDATLYKAAYKRLLYNPDTFHHLLQQQVAAPDGYQDLGITVGSPYANNTIIKVCNPYCGPCASAHPVLDEIIRQNNDYKLKLIFTASNDKDDKRGVAARHLLAIHKTSPELTEKSLDDWYLGEKKDYEAFAGKYPMNGEIKEQEAEIDRMKTWCDRAEISFTPTIYINGHRLPEKYSVQELKYIL